MPEFEYQKVWAEKDQALLDEIVSTWEKYGITVEGEAAVDRAKNVVLLVRNSGGEIIGISTARIHYINRLKANMFVYRGFVVPEYRRMKIMTNMVVITRDYLESIYESVKPHCLGIIAEIQNKGLVDTLRYPVYPKSKLALIGYSNTGNQIRVYYFQNVKFER